jgi:hypothetical protein
MNTAGKIALYASNRVYRCLSVFIGGCFSHLRNLRNLRIIMSEADPARLSRGDAAGR